MCCYELQDVDFVPGRSLVRSRTSSGIPDPETTGICQEQTSEVVDVAAFCSLQGQRQGRRKGRE